MPIYEYRCEACGHELEVLQKISDDPLTQCPQCKSEQLKKKVSAAAFRLKGSGWYETDFKSGNQKNLAASSDKDSSSSPTNESSKAGGSADGASKSGSSSSSASASSGAASGKGGSSGKPPSKKTD